MWSSQEKLKKARPYVHLFCSLPNADQNFSNLKQPLASLQSAVEFWGPGAIQRSSPWRGCQFGKHQKSRPDKPAHKCKAVFLCFLDEGRRDKEDVWSRGSSPATNLRMAPLEGSSLESFLFTTTAKGSKEKLYQFRSRVDSGNSILEVAKSSCLRVRLRHVQVILPHSTPSQSLTVFH